MTQEVKKFSFAKPGAAAPQPVEQPAPAAAPDASIPAESAANTGGDSPQNLPAVPPAYAPPAFYTGEEDEPSDPSDMRLPRLNIIQKSSKSAWHELGKIGTLLLKGEVPLGNKIRFVVAGARPKVWIEKTKYDPTGNGPKARVARSIDEVVKFGGTDQWRQSKESNEKLKGNSTKPWFMPSVTLAILIEKPTTLDAKYDDHFAYVVGDKAYAPALLSVKSTNYDAVWIFIASERRGVLSEGFNSHYIDATVVMKAFSGGESGQFQCAYGEKTPAELRAVAQKIATGS